MKSNSKRELRRLERAWLGLILFLLAVALVSVVRGEQSAIFAHYNLENCIVMDRRENGTVAHLPKPEKEIEPLVRIIREIHPDLLGWLRKPKAAVAGDRAEAAPRRRKIDLGRCSEKRLLRESQKEGQSQGD
jgi:hypothetical protein